MPAPEDVVEMIIVYAILARPPPFSSKRATNCHSIAISTLAGGSLVVNGRTDSLLYSSYGSRVQPTRPPIQCRIVARDVSFLRLTIYDTHLNRREYALDIRLPPKTTYG